MDPLAGIPALSVSALQRRRLRYAGHCVLCGAALGAGVEALWDPLARTVRCLACPSEEIDAGTPGGSAIREHERRSRRRQDHMKSVLGERVGGFVATVLPEPQSTRAWEIGAQGEEALADALAMVPHARALYDLRVRGTGGNIDCLAVAPAGVFVIDAKHYAGRIEVKNRGGLMRTDWRLYVGRRDHSDLADGMACQVDAVRDALIEGGVEPLPPITSVLCFVNGEWPLLGGPDAYGGVRLESPKSLRRLLDRSGELDDAEIERLHRVLAGAFPCK